MTILVLWRLKNTLFASSDVFMYWITVLAEICFRAKPASRTRGEAGFDLARTADQIRCSHYVLSCLCLCLGFSQITCKTLRLRTTSHLSQTGLTLARTFNVLLLGSLFLAWNRKWCASSPSCSHEVPF